MLVTPYDVEKALRNARPEYREMHEMNQHIPEIRACKIGTVFADGGEYYIYLGVNGRNRKYPCIALRVRDGSTRKMTRSFFKKIADA